MERPLKVRAVEELAVAGERAGFSVEEMIRLLNAGVSIEGLVEMIAQRLPDHEGRKPDASFDASSPKVSVDVLCCEF